jgi:hypothetical protein
MPAIEQSTALANTKRGAELMERIWVFLDLPSGVNPRTDEMLRLDPKIAAMTVKRYPVTGLWTQNSHAIGWFA